MDLTLGILTPHHILEDPFCCQWPDLLQHLHLRIPDGLGLILLGTIHRDDTKELQQMILYHIPQCATAVIIPPTLAHTYLFGNADLNMIDIVFIPERFEDVVRKTEGHDVLHHLFSQVMIDMIDLL